MNINMTNGKLNVHFTGEGVDTVMELPVDPAIGLPSFVLTTAKGARVYLSGNQVKALAEALVKSLAETLEATV